MTERKTRVPFTCPHCGTSSARGMKVGGLLSQRFRCASCGAYAEAGGYNLFSVLYGAIIVALAVAGLAVLDYFLGSKVRFEYFLVVVVLAVICLICVSADRYWQLVIRWRKADGEG